MKKASLVWIIVLLSTVAWAQVPQKMSYQAIIRNASNAANVTGTVAVANGGTGLTNITSGQIPFGNGTSAIGTSSNLTWDNSTGSLGIGTSTPASSAKLDVSSITQGFLPPRMTQAQRNAISSPASGLIIWCTDSGTRGQLQVYDGAGWTNMIGGSSNFACGTSSVTFTFRGASVTYGTVVGAAGKCWLDRNLGATRVATSSNDADAYGDLFQWGRGDEGHQLRNSSTTGTLSTGNTPGNSNFIIWTLASGDQNWRSTNYNYLWQGINGTNNVCPSGWRIPTEQEWFEERQAGFPANKLAAGYSSVLKLPAAGIRTSNGSVSSQGSFLHYWSSTTSGSANSCAVVMSTGSPDSS
ncbi:MAG: hypothetical protein FJZ76_00625 [Bacteroidetes bacterium]|nr:hypothetical protein [Bacteroidota bacterium]